MDEVFYHIYDNRNAVICVNDKGSDYPYGGMQIFQHYAVCEEKGKYHYHAGNGKDNYILFAVFLFFAAIIAVATATAYFVAAVLMLVFIMAAATAATALVFVLMAMLMLMFMVMMMLVLIMSAGIAGAFQLFFFVSHNYLSSLICAMASSRRSFT